jgi:hypothetical protein
MSFRDFSDLPGLPPGYVPIAPRRPGGYPEPPVRFNKPAGIPTQLSPAGGADPGKAVAIAAAMIAVAGAIAAVPPAPRPNPTGGQIAVAAVGTVAVLGLLAYYIGHEFGPRAGV